MLLFALTSEEPKTQETADDTSKSEEGNWQAASHSFIFLFFCSLFFFFFFFTIVCFAYV